MTPELQLAISLLTMPIQDIHNFVGNELLENPFLQEEGGEEIQGAQEEEKETDTADALASETFETDQPLDHDWENMYDGDGPRQSISSGSWDGEERDDNHGETEISLGQHLIEQLHLAVNTPTDFFLGSYLIDALDDAGYLRINITDAAQKLKVDAERLEDMLAVIQTFDPVGIAARDLADCLRLQLHAQDNLTDVADSVLQNLDSLAKQDFPKLCKLAKCEKEAILETVADISACNPKPGLAFARGTVDAVIPDVIVQFKEDPAGGMWTADLNSAAMPKVLLNKTAQDIFAGANDSAKTYINERTTRANWLVKSLEQRARTILKVSRLIVQEQADFFTYGVESLKPMTLRQVAEKADVHESTVSRVTSGKFMQTPLGTFELKHFFSAGIGTTGGNMEVAAQSVKAIIKRLIDAEDSKKPLSDEKLVTSLKGEGINIARRTVAKYREALQIGSSSERRLR